MVDTDWERLTPEEKIERLHRDVRRLYEENSLLRQSLGETQKALNAVIEQSGLNIRKIP